MQADNFIFHAHQAQRFMCLCRRPINWTGYTMINNGPYAGVFGPDEKKVQIPLIKTEINVDILESIAFITFVQEYENKEKTPIEALYKFPTSTDYAVTSMRCKIEDREVFTKIMEKNEAREKYDDAIASGHTAVKMEQDEALPDILSLSLGNLKAGKKATITVTMVNQLSTVSG